MRKQNRWRDASVASEYDERRFGTRIRSWKHARDRRLVSSLLGLALDEARRPERRRPRVLDLPCGTGRLMSTLAGSGARVVGADVSLEMMRMRSASDGAPMIQASAFGLPFRDGAFDATVSMRFLFHLDDANERVRVLRELGRVTSGLVIGQVRYRFTWKHAGRWLRSRVGLSRRYRPSHSRAEIATELAEAGLELVELCAVSRLFSDKALFAARRADARLAL